MAEVVGVNILLGQVVVKVDGCNVTVQEVEGYFQVLSPFNSKVGSGALAIAANLAEKELARHRPNKNGQRNLF